MMFDVLVRISGIVLPIFVFLTMFNVGLTQKLSSILHYLKDRGFGFRMIVANFMLAPVLMWGMLQIYPLEAYLAEGLTIFSICAGAAFLIKLTQLSRNNLALGASTMIALVLATVVFVPFLLPVFSPGIEINGFSIAWTLLKQLIFPLVLGLLLVKVLPKIMSSIQPWIAGASNWTLYILLVTILAGYFPELKEMMGEGALIMGIIFILGAFGLGYLLGGGREKEHLQDIGGLGTAQRNTAASMIIAAENFGDHPEVLVVITMANTVGIIILLLIAKFLSRDNQIKLIVPGDKLAQKRT